MNIKNKIIPTLSLVALIGVFLLSIFMTVSSAESLVKKMFKEPTRWVSVEVEHRGKKELKIFPSKSHYEAYKTVKFIEKKLDHQDPEIRAELDLLYEQTQNPEISSNALFVGLNFILMELKKLDNKKDPS